MIVNKYGLTDEQVHVMLAKQNYECAICANELQGSNWVIDHDHDIPLTTAMRKHAVRGILCTNCNNGLGQFKDNLGALEAAVEYLSTHQAKLYKRSLTDNDLFDLIGHHYEA